MNWRRRTGPLSLLALACLGALAVASCRKTSPPGGESKPSRSLVVVGAQPSAARGNTAAPPASATRPAIAASGGPGASSSAAPKPTPAVTAGSPPQGGSQGPPPADANDPASLHKTTTEDLVALFSLAKLSKKMRRRHNGPLFLKKNVGVGTPSKMNQGNPEIAKHDISYAKCMAGLSGIALQTKEQKDLCGADNMVPIYRKGNPKKAYTCIDIFEFPNKPCQLPFVWASPIQAKELCTLQGKRLCSQEEWIFACRGDPAGGDHRVYAYGDKMDLSVCNTNKRGGGASEEKGCNADSAKSAFNTCRTDTEPTGSHPQCRSRFGVFDMHGNVAEIMTRMDRDGHRYSQLKGSAFFYRDVARHHKKPQKKGGRETYPDHCAHNPRWHVEPMNDAWHVNYHLGFRCCKTIYH